MRTFKHVSTLTHGHIAGKRGVRIQPGSVLFSLLLVSHNVECDASLLSAIRNGPTWRGRKQSLGPRYFFLGVGFQGKERGDIRASSVLRGYRQFKLPRQSLLHDFGGKRPRLCVTTQKMTPQAGQNRVKILTFMFNFILNSDELQKRTPFQLNTSGNQECKSRSSTLEMLTGMYDTRSELYSFSQRMFFGWEDVGHLGNNLNKF